ncbi:transcription elongation factor SPT6 [Brachionus plicatilis]|uniref:Transcription elongation factor SPT6 n=1 Tax=Brachionus plicatilis TaxID=10195 RepID=A0A3M7RQ44_BRAPC|nr:transcription elongation factor SPT6 [Brachionus plicatilis]
MVAVQFAKEPAIRAYFRDLYMQRVCVNVRPSTNRGLNEIDETHACYPFKYLKMKPVRQIKHEEWLKLCQAEQDGLLIVSFECSPFDQCRPDDKEDWDEAASPPATTIADNKSVTIVDKRRSKWNKQRALIVDEMCGKFLMPKMECELKSRLAFYAKQYVFKQCCDKLESMLSLAPYYPIIESIDDEEDRLRVLAIAHNQEDEQPQDNFCVACVNSDGALNQFIYLKKLQLRTLCEQEWQVSVTTLVRHAVYLARYVQDPMLCMAQLCNQDRDLLGPMMQYVKFINVANDVGVDLNRCDVEPNSGGVLHFVCGLGPRKAVHILKVLRAGRLELKGTLTNKELSTYPVFPIGCVW